MIQLIKATIADLDTLAAIERQIFASGEDWQLSRRVFAYHLRRKNFLIQAATADQTVGYALVLARKHSARLYAIGVLPHFARQGIGQTLLTAAIAEAKRQGKKRLYLEVREQNRAAQTL